MPETPDVIQGEPVESDWGNEIRDRTLQRYSDIAERDSLAPFPVDGDLAWISDVQAVQVFANATWRSFGVGFVESGDLGNVLFGTGGLARFRLNADGTVNFFPDGNNSRFTLTLTGSRLDSELDVNGQQLINVPSPVTDLDADDGTLLMTTNLDTITITIDQQPDAVGVVAADLIPAAFRPVGGPIRCMFPSFTSGFGVRAGQFYTCRVNVAGTFEIQAFDPGFTAGDRIMGAVTYVAGAQGI